MESNVLSQLQFDASTAKRAQWEAFEFTLEAPGLVRVTNGSYGDDSENHSYRVNVENGIPVACECKADTYQKGACKHRVAVAIRGPVLSAGAHTPVVADGGQLIDAGDDGAIITENPDACENGQVGCCGPDGDDLPCFPCYQTRERAE